MIVSAHVMAVRNEERGSSHPLLDCFDVTHAAPSPARLINLSVIFHYKEQQIIVPQTDDYSFFPVDAIDGAQKEVRTSGCSTRTWRFALCTTIGCRSLGFFVGSSRIPAHATSGQVPDLCVGLWSGSSTAVFGAKAGVTRLPRLRIARSW